MPVVQVIPGSAADQGSGLQPGDLILAVNGVHISEFDENRLLEAFRGDDIVGSKCKLTIERPEAHSLGPVDVEVLRTNSSFAKEVELLFLLGQEHAALLQSQAGFDSLNASLQAMMHQAVALERHRILHEQVLAARLRSLQIRVLGCVTEAERQIKPCDSGVDPKRIQNLEERWEHMSELFMLLKATQVAPDRLAQSIKGAGMGATDVLRMLEAIKQQGKSTNEVVELINGVTRTNSDQARIDYLEAQLKAAQVPKECQTCMEKDEELAKIQRNPTKAQRAAPRAQRSAAPPPPTQATPPSIVPAGGKFDKVSAASITSDQPGAKIYYTTDGSAPTESNFAKNGDTPVVVQVDKSMRIRAMSSIYGRATQDIEAEFVIEAPPAALAGETMAPWRQCTQLIRLLLFPLTCACFPPPSSVRALFAQSDSVAKVQ